MSLTLEDRLWHMAIPLPPGLAERARAAAAAPVKPRRLPPLARPVLVGSISLGALVAANVTAGHYVPAYSRVLSDLPIAGSWLASAGLTAGQVTPARGSATSAGYTISVAGAYADAYRTLVFLEINGEPLHAIGGVQQSMETATLTDQFGHVYKTMYDGADGDTGVAFEPLTGDAADGAHLTLHLTRFVRDEPNAPTSTYVDGHWDLHFEVAQSAGGEPLPLPAAVTTAGTTFTVEELRHSGDVLHIRWAISGPTIERYRQLAYPSGRSSGSAAASRAEMAEIRGAAFPAGVVADDGTVLQFLTLGDMLPKDGGPLIGQITTHIDRPGHYTLEINFGGATAHIPIEVP